MLGSARSCCEKENGGGGGSYLGGEVLLVVLGARVAQVVLLLHLQDSARA